MKRENRPVEWAALGKEEAINWDEDHLHLTKSHPHASRATNSRARNGGTVDPDGDDQQWLADQVHECYGPAAVHRFWQCVHDGCFGLIPHWRWSVIELADVHAHISWVHFDLPGFEL